jgi:hypothetical protein
LLAQTGMHSLDRLIPLPRIIEQHHVDVEATAARAHALLRNVDLRRSALVRGLLALRAVPGRLRGQAPRGQALSLDDLTYRYGLRVLTDEPLCFTACTHESAIAIGLEIRCAPLGERAARVTAEVRVSADDEGAWRRVERAYRVIGPVGRTVMKHVLELAVNDFGAATTASAAPPLAQRA